MGGQADTCYIITKSFLAVYLIAANISPGTIVMAQYKIISVFFFVVNAISYIAGAATLGYGCYGVGKHGIGSFEGNNFALLSVLGALIGMSEMFGGVAALIKSRAMLIIHGVVLAVGTVVITGAAGLYLRFASQVEAEDAQFYYVGAGVFLIMAIVKIIEFTFAFIQSVGIKKKEE